MTWYDSLLPAHYLLCCNIIYYYFYAHYISLLICLYCVCLQSVYPHDILKSRIFNILSTFLLFLLVYFYPYLFTDIFKNFKNFICEINQLPSFAFKRLILSRSLLLTTWLLNITHKIIVLSFLILKYCSTDYCALSSFFKISFTGEFILP